ncbi:ABC transporter ATP-binding protein [Pseudarthrobacter sp. fls2-241-R2A-168]|uniref:ABC transporter ATP-binding protein n=1 Tax=Pseudarthrobacter sp. fls2-241-R2A-168 TaxID=3040304 RepID=UPI0025575445|nr:ABC transporter ATP-binding protein [Pseudarthrobacter sp. fls2-241-R2A-168]
MSTSQEILIKPDAAIVIDGVSKTYHSRSSHVTALKDISLSVKRGGFVAIVGPSGCGKTTLLRMMAGLEARSEGRISLNGEAVHGPSSKFGMVFQRPVLLEWRTIRRNVLLPVELKGKPTPADHKNIDRLLSLVGLSDFGERYPRELSGGMQQRAAICRALIDDPEVILLDEPFGALDAMTREHLNLEFNALWRSTGKTVVMITHDIPEAVFLAERVVVMSARPGRIVEIVNVPFGPLRDESVLADPVFGALAAHIRALLETEEAE